MAIPKETLLVSKRRSKILEQKGGIYNRVLSLLRFMKGVFMNHRYAYCGPVLEFGSRLTARWKGETVAPSEEKARNNLAYQYKKLYNKPRYAKIDLPGELKIVG
jgi:hypothetical protein